MDDTIIDCSFQDLSSATESIKTAWVQTVSSSKKKTLVNVDLKYNDITTLENTGIPVTLGKLELNVNHLSEFPNLLDFKYLIELSLSYNQISSLRAENLPEQIEVIKINGNQLKSVPNLKKFKWLRIFEAKCNQISKVWGLPESIEDLDLSGNPITYLALDCFPSEEVYDLLKTSLPWAELIEPSKAKFAEGYLQVMTYFVDLRVIRRKLNRLFKKYYSLKVQSMYEDKSWYKVVVNVKNEHMEKVRELLNRKYYKHYVELVEQPCSPKLLSGRIASGTKIEITNKDDQTTGCITGKIIDKNNTVYVMTCRHIFCEEIGNVPCSVESIHACTDNNVKIDIGDTYTGIFGPFKSNDEDGSDDCDMNWIDVALVPIKKDKLQQIDDIIKDRYGEKCNLYLYSENCNCDIEGEEVEKFGPVTNRTFGKILKSDFTYFHPPSGRDKEGQNAFMIEPISQDGQTAFIQKGDSGSLITTTLRACQLPETHIREAHNLENHAIGIAVACQDKYKFRSRKCEREISNVGFGVKLYLNLQALEDKFPHLKELKICFSGTTLHPCGT